MRACGMAWVARSRQARRRQVIFSAQLCTARSLREWPGLCEPVCAQEGGEEKPNEPQAHAPGKGRKRTGTAAIPYSPPPVSTASNHPQWTLLHDLYNVHISDKVLSMVLASGTAPYCTSMARRKDLYLRV